MRVDLRPAEPHDPAWFAPRLRPADTAELTAASGPDVRATLERAEEIQPRFNAFTLIDHDRALSAALASGSEMLAISAPQAKQKRFAGAGSPQFGQNFPSY